MLDVDSGTLRSKNGTKTSSDLVLENGSYLSVRLALGYKIQSQRAGFTSDQTIYSIYTVGVK